jgi:hypothetical protein
MALGRHVDELTWREVQVRSTLVSLAGTCKTVLSEILANVTKRAVVISEQR